MDNASVAFAGKKDSLAQPRFGRVWLHLAFGAALVCSKWVGCHHGGGQPAVDTAAKADIVAMVNDTPIKTGDLDAATARAMPNLPFGKLAAASEARIKRTILEQMIDDALLVQKGKQLGVIVTDTQLDQKMKAQRARFATEQKYQDYLARTKSSEETIKEMLRTEIMRDQVLDKIAGPLEVSDVEVEDYYKANTSAFSDPDLVKLREIRVRFAGQPLGNQPGSQPALISQPTSEGDKHKARAKIDAALKKIKAGRKFEDVAKEVSDDSSQSQGGDLGYVARGRLPALAEAAAFKLEPGQVSDVIEGPSGYFLLKVEERKAARQKGFDEVKAPLKERLVQRKRSDALDSVQKKLRSEAKVQMYLELDVGEEPGGLRPSGQGVIPIPPP